MLRFITWGRLCTAMLVAFASIYAVPASAQEGLAGPYDCNCDVNDDVTVSVYLRNHPDKSFWKIGTTVIVTNSNSNKWRYWTMVSLTMWRQGKGGDDLNDLQITPQSNCNDCNEDLSPTYIDANDVSFYTVTLYRSSFSCVGNNCTLTMTLISSHAFKVTDGSTYYGSGAVSSVGTVNDGIGGT